MSNEKSFTPAVPRICVVLYFTWKVRDLWFTFHNH